MRAVVLVGGEGTRLRPLTYTTPKQMLPVGRRPMIERVVEHLASHGVDEAVLSLGYRPHAFIEAYPDGRCAGVALAYAVEPEPLDTAGAVAFAAHQARIDSTFVVHNGDVLTGLDLGALLELHRRSGAEATISLTPVEEPSRFGVVPTDEEGRVLAFIEKPRPGEAPTNLINAGTYVLEPSVLERIPAGRRVSIERETFPALAADRSLYAMASAAAWVDAGTPETYLAANLAHAAAPDGSCRIASGAFVEGSAVGSGVSVGEC
ncbi:MAG: nucleotidyltransferase family protein [Acidimicrobiales bacterium]